MDQHLLCFLFYAHSDQQPNKHPNGQGDADVLREHRADGGAEAHPQAHSHRLIAVFHLLFLFFPARPTKNTARAIPVTISGNAAIIKSRINFHSFLTITLSHYSDNKAQAHCNGVVGAWLCSGWCSGILLSERDRPMDSGHQRIGHHDS